MPSLSVVIPTLNAAAVLVPTLAALRAGGIAAEITIADAGSVDGTQALALAAGARLVVAERGRGPQLAAGAESATGDWLLFLHADTRLAEGWADAVTAFIADPANRSRAAHFRFALDDDSARAQRLERAVSWRCRVMGLPYGDQGLLIARDVYRSLGGFRPIPLMEDVDLVRRIGKKRLTELPVAAVTSAAKWRRDGWTRRSVRNLFCLTLWFLGVPPRLIVKVYG